MIILCSWHVWKIFALNVSTNPPLPSSDCFDRAWHRIALGIAKEGSNCCKIPFADFWRKEGSWIYAVTRQPKAYRQFGVEADRESFY